MQLLKTLIHAIGKWFTDLLLLIIEELGKVPFLGEKGAIIFVYVSYLTTLILFSVLCIVFFLKKKYKQSIYFLFFALLMIGYFITLAYNIGHKAD